MELPILYEDDDVVAINKPAGLVTHSDGRTKEPTAEEWFNDTYPESGGGYVHRLDRDTSGVLLFAKRQETYEFLRKAFHDRTVRKTYVALVYGVVKAKRGIIDFDIGRSRSDFRLRSAQPKAKGRLREALTRYEVIGTLVHENESYSLLMVTPETGRTHQIRVHLKAIHHPIIADPLYAPNLAPGLGLTRLGLHAFRLEVPLPRGGEHTIVASLPADIAEAVRRFGVDESYLAS